MSAAKSPASVGFLSGQIEYSAPPGLIADETELTVVESREVIARCYVRHGPTGNAEDESIEPIESRFTRAEASGQLAQAVRDAVNANATQLARWAAPSDHHEPLSRLVKT